MRFLAFFVVGVCWTLAALGQSVTPRDDPVEYGSSDDLQKAGMAASFALYEKHGPRWRAQGALRLCNREGIAKALELSFDAYADEIVVAADKFKLRRDQFLPLAYIVHNGIRWYAVAQMDSIRAFGFENLSDPAKRALCESATRIANQLLEKSEPIKR